MGLRTTEETKLYCHFVPIFGTVKILILVIFVKLQSVNYGCTDAIWSTVHGFTGFYFASACFDCGRLLKNDDLMQTDVSIFFLNIVI